MFTNSERNDIEQEKNAEAGLKFFEVKVLYNQNSPLSPHYPFNNPIHTKASLLITKSQSNQLCTVGKQSSAQRLQSQNISATSDHKQQNRQIAESFSPPKKASLSKPLQTARVRYRELYKQSIDSYFNNRKGNYPLPVFRKTVQREDSGEIPLICRKFINIQKANISILESSSISQRRNYNSFNRDKSRDGRRQRQGVLGSNCISMNIHGKKKRLYDSFTEQNYSARVQSNYVQKRSTKVIYRISNQRIEGISQDQNKSEDQNNNGFTQEYQQELKDTQEPNLTNGRNKEKDKKQFKVYPAPFLMQIRKPITRKQYFVFGLADRTDNHESIYNTYPLDKMESFRDFLWKINYSNGLHVVTPQNLQSSYKAFIGDGNNSYLIRGVLRKRFWWNVVDGPIGKAQQPSIKGQQIAVQTQSRLITDCHFVWTQLKVNEYFSCQKQLNGRPFQQCLSQIQVSQKIFPQQVSSETFSSEVHPIVTTFTEPQFLNQGDPHCKIFSPKDYSNWKAHYQKQQKYQRRITIQTYVKRLSLYHKKPMQKIEESQKLRVHNHLQQNFYIGNKKALFYNLVLYYGLQEKDPFKEAIPLTFHVRKGMEDPQYIKFLQIYKQVDLEKDKKSQNYTPRKNIWIVKPGENTNRGTGITVAYHLDDIKMRLRGKQKNRDGQYRTFIIQKYIDKPFLYHRRKFDIRHYVLVCCINGLFKAYWFEEGYIRTSSYEFSTKPNKDPLVHLTNDAIQKNSAQYGKFQRGNKLSYAEFQKYLNKVGKKLNHQPKRQINFFEEVLPQMKRIAIDAVKATYGILDHTRKGHNFQLLGLDFMIDQDFKAWLIQINTNPCLETSSPLLQRIIPSLIDNTFRLTIDPLFPPPQNIPTNRKISSYQNPLSDNKFTLIFDEAYDGQQVQKLFGEMVFGQERIDRRMGDIEQEEDVFEEEGGEKQKLAAEGLGLTI